MECSILAWNELEEFKGHYENGEIGDIKYLDTWDYEDDYSHNEIEEARDDFIKMANKYLEREQSPYYMGEINENAMLCYKGSDAIVRSTEADTKRKIITICELLASCNDINEIVKVCKEIGVRIKNDDGTYRHFYDVLSDLSNVYNS